MVHLIFDTNFIHLDYRLKGSNIKTVIAAKSKTNIKVYMPMVVFDEMVHQYVEDTKSLQSTYKSFQRQLNRCCVEKQHNLEIDIDSTIINRSKYEVYLKQKCEEYDIHFLPYPKVEHRDVVERKLYGKKPFKNSGEGYCDTLIWETILDFCKDINEKDQVLFVTDNTSDFAGKDKQLHPELLSDLNRIGFNPNHFELITNGHDYVNNQLLPLCDKLEQYLEDLINNGVIGNINVIQLIEDNISSDFINHYIQFFPENDTPCYIPMYYENPTIQYIDEPFNFTYHNVRQLASHEILIQLEVKVEVDIDFYIYKGDYALIDDDKLPSVFDWDWNRHYIAASDKAEFTFQVNIMSDENLTEANTLDIRVSRVKYSSGIEYTVPE